MFSQRTSWDFAENDFAAALRVAGAHRTLLDLTVANPTACGFHYAPGLLDQLSQPAAFTYHPDPLGMRSAREGVAAYYAEHGAPVDPAHICLTTSTSEAYSFLFRTLCDPGDEVLIAAPSYPLFDYIAQLDGVRLRTYPLLCDEGAGPHGTHTWSIDQHALEAAIGNRTRGVVLVHPNNPTGNFASGEEQHALQKICAKHGLALIVDEVFLDYSLTSAPQTTFASADCEALTFVLSGLSKVCALPQMKASWIVACGPSKPVHEALSRLEVVADTFLSMNAPVQHALPGWLAGRGHIQQQIRARLAHNLRALDAALHATHVQRLAVEGGWNVVLRVPRFVDGQPFAHAALARDVVVQPGEFYGLSQNRVVLSLLTPPAVWNRGLAALPLS